MWPLIAGVGFSILKGSFERAQIRAQNQVEEAKAAGANKVRAAQNVEKAANNSLAYWMQSENNNRRLEAGAKQLEAGVTTMQRMQEAYTRQDIEQELQLAEGAGAYAAHAAMTGTSGNAVDVIDMTMRMKNGRQRQAIETTRGQADYDTMTQLTGIMPQTLAGLDSTYMNAGLDYGTTIANTRVVSGNILSDAVQGVMMAGGGVSGGLAQLGAAGSSISNFFSSAGAASTGSTGTGFTGGTYGFQPTGGTGLKL